MNKDAIPMTHNLDEAAQLEQALAALEAQRAVLGDAAVDAAQDGIRRQLTALQAPPDRRRRQVTVLFADVCGFTAMSEALDAEDVHEIINTLWRQLDRVIGEHGGTIDKHLGDGVMALWGSQAAHEDDPEWAVRAALAMQQELAGFEVRLGDLLGKLRRRGLPAEVRMRIGVNTGPVLLGDVGTTGEVSAIGDAVNLASRVQEAAPVGGVLITHSVYRQVRGIFDMAPQSPVQLKGKAEPVQTYQVLRVKPRAFRMRTRGVEGIETTMVGRDAELRALQAAYHATVEQGVPHVITVVGEAGVGKSRLLYEFENWLELAPEQIYYLKGRATPEMQRAAYSILRDMFAYRFDIRESDGAVVVLEKFRTGMAGMLPPDQADLVGQWIGFDFQHAGSQAVQNLLGSTSFGGLAANYLITFMRGITQRPTVIFLEDIHWADDRSLDLLQQLVGALPEARLMVVCLTRHTLFEHRPQWGAGDAAAPAIYQSVALTPLSLDASHALVAQILQKLEDVPPTLFDLIIGGAEGNPYYVEELIKMLLDDGVIQRGEERWQVELSRLKTLRAPDTLTGVLQARLDSLPRDERDVLQRAAVVGRLFWDAAVSALVADMAEATPDRAAQVRAALAAMQERELIFRRPQSAFQDAAEYIFKHAILRDVTYETVLLNLRRLYHRQAARWLEAHAGERLGEYLDLIATHYELAGENVKAADYLLRSGRAAQAVSAYPDARVALERALALLPAEDVENRASALVRLGYVYQQLSDYPMAQSCLEQGLALARVTRQAPLEVAALTGLGRSLMGEGKYDEARAYLDKALSWGRHVKDRPGIALALHHLGDVAYRQGDSDKAAQYAWECLALYQALEDRQGIAGAFRILGFVAYMRGQYADAMRHHEESRRIYLEIGDRWGVGSGYVNLGESARRQEKFAEAAQYYEKGLPIFIEIGNRQGVALTALNLGHAYNGMEDLELAKQHFRQAMEKAQSLGAMAVVLESVMGLAWVYAKEGRAASAAEWVGWVQQHPDYNAEIAQFSAPIMALLHAALPEAEVQAALERGATLELAAVMQEIGDA